MSQTFGPCGQINISTINTQLVVGAGTTGAGTDYTIAEVDISKAYVSISQTMPTSSNRSIKAYLKNSTTLNITANTAGGSFAAYVVSSN